MDQINVLAGSIVVLSLVLLLYTYVGYPAILWVVGRFVRPRELKGDEGRVWPSVSITVPAYNEEAQIEGLIQSLLALDYPKDKLQILIVSDASSDGTHAIVESYANQGIDLLPLDDRGGKTKAENAAVPFLRGEIVINTDASIRISPGALKDLERHFDDPTVGLASGRDVSVGAEEVESNVGESSYVGYEMGVRDLETRVTGIVGASGCFYAIRSKLHRTLVPESLSRDFAAALHTRENGFRAVSVPSATCLVPRAPSLRREYKRKVRTITRGMETLAFKKVLLNPFRAPLYSWMLVSHKVCRWVIPWAGAVTFLAVGVLSLTYPWARVLFGFSSLFLLLAWIGWVRSGRAKIGKLFAIPAFVVAGNLAAAHAFIRFLRGDRNPVWEPTRREVQQPG